MKINGLISALIISLITTYAQENIKRDRKDFSGVEYEVQCILFENPIINVYKSIGEYDLIHMYEYKLNLEHIVSDLNSKSPNKILSVRFLDKNYMILVEALHGVYIVNVDNNTMKIFHRSEFNDFNELEAFYRIKSFDGNSIVFQKFNINNEPVGGLFTKSLK